MGAVKVPDSPLGGKMSQPDDGQIQAFLKDILVEFDENTAEFARKQIETLAGNRVDLERLYWRCKTWHGREDFQRFAEMSRVRSDSQTHLIDLD
jgi:hypothetical protein